MSPDVHTLTGAYVLDGLDEFEQRQFERHLAACADCAVEVSEFAMVAAQLGLAVAESPPTRLRNLVLAEIAGVRQSPGVAGLSSRGRTWLVRMSAVVATGALVGAAAAAVVVTGAEHRLSATRSQLAQSESMTAPVMRLLSQADTRTIAGPGVNGSGEATMISSDQLGDGLLMVTDVPRDGTYQAWLIGPNGARSAGLLGTTGAPLLLHGLPGVQEVAVTAEPAGGSTVPTTIPVLVISLA